ncbi:nose resistant to fluoxetine protein 6 [Trichonephila clavipes]|nr:nose resistant to fluoxetine protein 6 [Trichonephila clavipes]
MDSLKCFSVNKNLNKLLKISHSKENFGVLNGMRVLSMVWVVLVHTYGFNHKQSFAFLVFKPALDKRTVALNEVTFGTIINAWVIVDTFFVLGAFLVAHSNLKALDRKNGRLNFLRYYLHRIWRLTPPVAGVLLVMFLLPLLGSGPLWQDVIGKQVANCEKYWWQALIIPINTWTHFDDMCLLHTWYIASDLHLYFIAPLILIPLYRWPAIGFLVMLVLTVACMGIMAAVTIINDFYPTLLYFTPNEKFTHAICDLVYFRPYPHMGAYCIGLALGYFVLNYRKINIKPIVQILGWCGAIACNLAVLYGAFEWNRGNLPTRVVDVVYAMFHRTAWAFGIAWLIFICITGRGGLINRFLSWDFFIPLGRLSYSAYILHFPVLWVRNGIRRERLHFHHYDIFYEFLATLILTLCLSVTFHLLFEAPFLNLEEVWFPKKSKSKEKEKKIENGTTIVPVAKMENVLTNGHATDVFSGTPNSQGGGEKKVAHSKNHIPSIVKDMRNAIQNLFKKNQGHGATPLRVKEDIEDVSSELATRGLLMTDFVILSHGQVTKTTLGIAPTSSNFHSTPTGRRLSLDGVNGSRPSVHGGSSVEEGSNS